MNENGVTTDYKEISEIFSKFFVEVGPNINNSINDNGHDPLSFLSTNESSIFLLPTDDHEIASIIKEMRQTSSGDDNISVSVIKALSNALTKPLAHIINLSMTQGKFPKKLKSALVIPIFKNGNRTLAQNYRPISILPIFAKLFEKVVYKRIYNFLESQNIISPTQFGFRQNHSTEHALIYFIDFVTKSLEDGKHAIGVYLDVKKAFDSVNHTILKRKLYKYGMRGKCAELLENYLQDRTQRVKIGDHLSHPRKLTCGIPQGSVLGPLLFIIYINDLNNISNKLNIITFADDTNLFLSNKEFECLESNMNNELKRVKTWFESNKLKLNTEKTCYQVYTKHNSSVAPKIMINDISIKCSPTVKFLGLHVDSQLTFKEHIKKLCTKLCQIAGIISRSRWYLSQNYRLLLYNTLVLPHLNYCCLIWGINFKSNLNCILMIQKRIARTILGLNYRDSVTHRFKDIDILSIYNIVIYKAIVFAYKHLNNFQPTILRELLIERAPNITRNHDTFDIPFTRHTYRRHTPKFFIPETWNKMQEPCSLTRTIKLSTLKANAKSHLLINQGPTDLFS